MSLDRDRFVYGTGKYFGLKAKKGGGGWKKVSEEELRALHKEGGEKLATGAQVSCVACAEPIRGTAKLCRHCGTLQNGPAFSGEKGFRDTNAGTQQRLPGTVSRVLTAAIIGVLIGVAGLSAALLGGFISDRNDAATPDPSEELQASTPAETDGMDSETDSERTVREVYDLALPSIVTVECGPSLGSGFSYDIEPANGYRSVVVTNHHVIEECTYEGGPGVSVVTNDSNRPSSELWNWDGDNDLAIIMVRDNIPALRAADEAEIGDRVVAIGSPEGFTGTITSGIISQIYSDAYQTDAALNHGNSGGPLLDMGGNVLGVNTLGIGREGLNIAFRPELLCERLVSCS